MRNALLILSMPGENFFHGLPSSVIGPFIFTLLRTPIPDSRRFHRPFFFFLFPVDRPIQPVRDFSPLIPSRSALPVPVQRNLGPDLRFPSFSSVAKPLSLSLPLCARTPGVDLPLGVSPNQRTTRRSTPHLFSMQAQLPTTSFLPPGRSATVTWPTPDASLFDVPILVKSKCFELYSIYYGYGRSLLKPPLCRAALGADVPTQKPNTNQTFVKIGSSIFRLHSGTEMLSLYFTSSRPSLLSFRPPFQAIRFLILSSQKPPNPLRARLHFFFLGPCKISPYTFT